MKDRHIRKFINYLENRIKSLEWLHKNICVKGQKRAEEKKKREREARWKAEEEANEKRRKEIGAFGRWREDSILLDLIKKYKWGIAIGAFIVFIIIINK